MMRNGISRYLIAILMFWGLNNAFATNYYIDAVSGNDGNNGTSQTSAWRTLSKLNASWNIIQAGDSILLKRGQSWRPSTITTTAVIQIPSGKIGSSNNYITIGAYGSGAKPIISTSLLSGKMLILGTNFHYFVFQDLQLRGQVEFSASSGNTGITNLKFLRLDWDGNAINDAAGGGWRFFTNMNETAPETYTHGIVSDIEFGYCTFRNNREAYSKDILNFNTPRNNVWIHHNEFYNAVDECLDFGGGDYITVEYNIFSGSQSANVVKIQPQIHTLKNLIVRGNLILGSNAFGLVIYNATNGKIYNNTIRPKPGASGAVLFGWATSSPVYISNLGSTGFDDNDIANNIFYGRVILGQPDTVKVTYKNGTILNVYHRPPVWSNNTFRHNLYYNPAIPTLISQYRHKGNTHVYWQSGILYGMIADIHFNDPYWTSSNFSDWQSKSNVLNDKYGNPLFKNDYWNGPEDFGDFGLDNSSPALGAGVVIADFLFDLTGAVIPSGAYPNIGAYQSNISDGTDVTAPSLLNANILNSETVELIFSEQLGSSEASSIENYNISDGINVISASLSGNKTIVTLVTSSHAENTNYTITANNLKDLAGNQISASSNSASYILQGTISNGISINAKIYLQGAYANSSMSTELHNSGSLPMSQPYNASPWNHGIESSNLFNEGSGTYETNTESWQIYGSNIIQTSSEWSNSGNKSIKIQNVSDHRGGYLYFREVLDLTTNLIVGNKYKLSFYAKSSAGNLKATLRDALNSNTPEYSAEITGSASRHEIEFTASNATMNYLRFDQMINGQSVYIDDMRLVEADGSSIESVSSLPEDVVDWVLLEIRSDISSSSLIKRKTAFVKSDGLIVDLNGASQIEIPDVPAGNYYLVVYHRNHLAIMSSSPIAFSNTTSLFDFTTGQNKAYGIDPLIDLGNGKYGMIAGDGDSNGIINVLDYSSVGNNIFQAGYRNGDLDLNNIVNVLDYSRSSSVLFRTSQVPN